MKPRKQRNVWGSMYDPVRTNQRYPGYVGGVPPGVPPFQPEGQLLTNMPDSWELNGGGPMPWLANIADNGQPPAWWVGESREDGWSPIGPHGPWRHGSWARAVVIRCTELIADPLVSDPFKVTRDPVINEPGGRSEAIKPDRWITDPQLLRSDDRVGTSAIPHYRRLARSTFYREWVRAALWYGMGYISYSPRADGQPEAGTMDLLPGRAFWLDEDTGVWWFGNPREDYDLARPIDPNTGEYSSRGGRRRLLILRNPHSPVDEWGRARGVFDLNPDTFMTAWMIDQYLAGAFRSGVPNGYLKVTQPNITQDQADMLKARWMGAHGRAKSIAVLNQSTEFVPLTWSPVDANVQEMKRLAMADVAFAFGIAPEVLGVSLGLSGTYSNIKDWWRLHRDFSLSGWIDQMGGALTALVPEQTNVSVNLDAHTRPDLSERVAIMQAAEGTSLDLAAMAERLDLPYDERGRNAPA